MHAALCTCREKHAASLVVTNQRSPPPGGLGSRPWAHSSRNDPGNPFATLSSPLSSKNLTFVFVFTGLPYMTAKPGHLHLRENVSFFLKREWQRRKGHQGSQVDVESLGHWGAGHQATSPRLSQETVGRKDHPSTAPLGAAHVAGGNGVLPRSRERRPWGTRAEEDVSSSGQTDGSRSTGLRQVPAVSARTGWLGSISLGSSPASGASATHLRLSGPGGARAQRQSFSVAHFSPVRLLPRLLKSTHKLCEDGIFLGSGRGELSFQ